MHLDGGDERSHGIVQPLFVFDVEMAIGEGIKDSGEAAEHRGEGDEEEQGEPVGEAHGFSGAGSPSR